MVVRRIRKGFKPLGQIRVRDLDVPARRAKELLLAHAWRRVAGEALFERLRARGVRRGVLEIEVGDPRWARGAGILLPKLAGRLATESPDLGVRKVRLRVSGEPLAKALSLAQEPGSPPGPEYSPRPAETAAGESTGATDEDPRRRLERLARLYLKRVSSSSR